MAFIADGAYLVSAGWDAEVRVWDLSSGKRVRSLSGHTEPIAGLSISSDDAVFATGSRDGTIRLWAVE